VRKLKKATPMSQASTSHGNVSGDGVLKGDFAETSRRPKLFVLWESGLRSLVFSIVVESGGVKRNSVSTGAAGIKTNMLTPMT